MSAIDLPEVGERGPASIRLRLLRSHGGVLDGVLVVPSAGCGLASALELGGERLNDTQWRAANLCRITPRGDDWQLVNASHTLVCTLNGERVRASQSALLAPGDTLELSLLCFEVESDPEAAVAAPSAAFRMTPPVPAPAMTQAVADAVEFDLRDLAFPPAGAGEAPGRGHVDDPFGVLDIAGAEARPAADTLAELLGEAVAPRSSAGRYPDPLRAHSEMPPTSAGRASGVTQRASMRASIGPAAQTAALLFDGLHEEFVRVVQDPTQLAGRADWEGIFAPDSEQAPTLEELRRQAEPYPLLRDILLPREGIDQVIADFDPLGRSTLLDIDESEEVLRLFAPEIAWTRRTSVPSLTRREHHALSPDSYMQLGVAQPDDTESP